jgi:hypothetical protein
MQVEVKNSDGKTVVLKQSYKAKIALHFSEKHCLVNALNLAVLSELSYGEYLETVKRLAALNFRDRVNLSRKGKSAIFPFLLPYTGTKPYSSEGITEILAAPSSLSIINTQGFHYNDDEFNIFVFRGTLEKQDLAADGFAPKIEFLGPGHVHEGF